MAVMFGLQHQATDTYVVVETAFSWDGTERQRELACFSNPADAETFVRRVNARPGREGFYYLYSVEVRHLQAT